MKKVVGAGFLVFVLGILLYFLISMKNTEVINDVINDAEEQISLISVRSLINIIDNHIFTQLSLGFEGQGVIDNINDVYGAPILYKGLRVDCLNFEVVNNQLYNGYVVVNFYKFSLSNGKLLEKNVLVDEEFCKGDL